LAKTVTCNRNSCACRMCINNKHIVQINISSLSQAIKRSHSFLTFVPPRCSSRSCLPPFHSPLKKANAKSFKKKHFAFALFRRGLHTAQRVVRRASASTTPHNSASCVMPCLCLPPLVNLAVAALPAPSGLAPLRCALNQG
jgi:hypothetical protein